MHGRRWVYDRGRRSHASGVYAKVRVGSKYIKRRVYKHRSLLVNSKALTVRGMVEKKSKSNSGKCLAFQICWGILSGSGISGIGSALGVTRTDILASE